VRKLYHFTPRRNAATITTLGLRVEYAQTQTPAIWLCAFRMLSWTLAHIRAKYQLPRELVCCYKCRLPSSWLFSASKGLWLCYQNIPIDRMEMVTT